MMIQYIVASIFIDHEATVMDKRKIFVVML